jgi:very-short-patch-repair endonuclease
MPQFRPRPTKRAQQLRNDATDAERTLWRHLSHRQLQGFKFSRQMPVGPFICDFVCRERMLVVELDGGQHSDRAAQDARRTNYLQQQGLTVLRFWNNDVLQNTDGVLSVIVAKLQDLPPRFVTSPLPLAGGEEPRSGEGVGPKGDHRTHPQPPPASGRGLA